MPMVKTVRKRIATVEGFEVRFRHSDGRSIRGDRKIEPHYEYGRQAKKGMTVGEWKKTRFKRTFPEFDVAVLDGDGEEVAGQTKLETVRKSYG